jgi:hypothetical protein
MLALKTIALEASCPIPGPLGDSLTTVSGRAKVRELRSAAPLSTSVMTAPSPSSTPTMSSSFISHDVARSAAVNRLAMVMPRAYRMRTFRVEYTDTMPLRRQNCAVDLRRTL